MSLKAYQLQCKEQEIKALYLDWREAIMANDIQFLQKLFADDFHSIRSLGKPKGKADELLWLGIGNVQYLHWEDRKLSIETTEHNATVCCSQSLQVLLYDLPTRIEREILLTFTKEDKQWHLQQFKEIPTRFTDT